MAQPMATSSCMDTVMQFYNSGIILGTVFQTIDHGRLASRDFDFASFYKSVSASVGATPVGVQFYQSTWDPSVRETFHTTLGQCQ